MIKLTDYICNYLVSIGVRDVFMISGGGAMHLVDSVGRHPDLTYLCPHHEQAAAIAAEGYARTSGKLGVVVVTSGPGGTNTLTGVIGQWLDSVPVLYLSGQVKQETTIERCRELDLRQLGDQEINIVDIMRPVTKYASVITEPSQVRHQLEKAVHLATSGRPGPVWLDIPLDVQSAAIDESDLPSYEAAEDTAPLVLDTIYSKIEQLVGRLKISQRPIIVAGHGVRISRAQELLMDVIEGLNIPVVTTFNGFDLVPSDHPLYIGRIGTIGDRAGNFALQNSDLLISIGTRNNIRQISYNWKTFARGAFKVSVDIDAAELKKPTFQPDLPINADAGLFLAQLKKVVDGVSFPGWEPWHNWCLERKKRYPVVLPEYAEMPQRVIPYVFVQVLTDCLTSDAIVVAGNGSACVALFQAGVVKRGQRMFWNSGCASMGYDLPAAIGACVTQENKDVVCLAGDGSLQMNIQELQTMYHYKLPIKLFVLNNEGYVSIRQTQDSFFEGRHVACDHSCGVSFPNIRRIADSYGIPVALIDKQRGMRETIMEVLNTPGPVVCEVLLPADYKFAPKLSSEKKPDGRIISKPLEDMYPFLERDEFAQNMIIAPVEEN